MNDRELLELAAKAAGYDGVYGDNEHPGGEGIFTSDFEVWNPLTDDGDALRLAVKLKMRVDIGGSVVVAFITDDAQHHEDFTDSHYSATRRAIVRAAAEIGKLK